MVRGPLTATIWSIARCAAARCSFSILSKAAMSGLLVQSGGWFFNSSCAAPDAARRTTHAAIRVLMRMAGIVRFLRAARMDRFGPEGMVHEIEAGCRSPSSENGTNCGMAYRPAKKLLPEVTDHLERRVEAVARHRDRVASNDDDLPVGLDGQPVGAHRRHREATPE